MIATMRISIALWSVVMLVLVAAAAVAPLASGLATAASAGSGTEHFSLIDTSTASHPSFSVIATGMFTAGGTALEKKTPVKEFILRFPAGTVTLTPKGAQQGRSPRASKVQTGTACLQATHTTTNYTIAGGTGAFKGISGSGTMTRSETFVEAESGGNCANGFLAVQAVISASGSVSLP